MTRLDALRELRDRVRNGTFDAPPDGARSPYFNRFMETAEDALPQDVMAVSTLAWRAYSGSVDSAIAFVQGVLPGWEFCIDSESGATVYSPHNFGVMFDGDLPDNLSRALLLAALEALIEQESA